ncbi:hypothetical protein RUM44_000548 [Polyplax serrata]|uniref:Uncharacterized protein n=1 Tax=Polyplax serrata TaxID=468196 RepID=A0ABR1B6U4_POLSC
MAVDVGVDLSYLKISVNEIVIRDKEIRRTCLIFDKGVKKRNGRVFQDPENLKSNKLGNKKIIKSTLVEIERVSPGSRGVNSSVNKACQQQRVVNRVRSPGDDDDGSHWTRKHEKQVARLRVLISSADPGGSESEKIRISKVLNLHRLDVVIMGRRSQCGSYSFDRMDHTS